MKTKPHRIPQKLLVGSVLAAISGASYAGAKISIDQDRWISLGVGLRTSVASVEKAAPDGSSRAADFNLENMRLYIAGQASKEMGFYIGTEKMWGEYGVLDAMVKYEPSATFNIWAGRMLTPADRIEMNGPFYGLTWGQYTVPLYPSDNDVGHGANGLAGTYGRDEGVTVWGSMDKLQYAFGVFDGYSAAANQKDEPLYATRIAYNFLTKEANPGYYTSSTYFGQGGDILTLGISAQHQGDGYGTATVSGSFTGYAVDGLFEKPLAGGSAVTIEGEYKKFSVGGSATTPDFPMFDGKAYFGTVAYLVGDSAGPGKFQPYMRYTKNEPSTGKVSDLTELGVNYVISGQNMKVNLNYTSGDANASGAAGTDHNAVTLGMQFQL